VKEQDEDFARSFVEHMMDYGLSKEDKKKVQVKTIREIPETKTKYKCLICEEFFDTKTAKGKMHMAKHGLNLRGALRLGKCKVVG
jgi:hypothetical protein